VLLLEIELRPDAGAGSPAPRLTGTTAEALDGGRRRPCGRRGAEKAALDTLIEQGRKRPARVPGR